MMKRTIWIPSLFVLAGATVYLWWSEDPTTTEEKNLAESPPVEPEITSRSDNEERTPATITQAPVEDPPAEAPLAAHEDLADDDDFEEESDPITEARRIRLPVIQAIRTRHPSPEARRQAMLEALEGSGESTEEWTAEAKTTFGRWDRALTGEIERHVDERSARCFRAGCEVTVVFPDRTSYEQAAAEFRRIREEGAIHGGRVQTPGVEREDGAIEASWLMMRPDGTRS